MLLPSQVKAHEGIRSAADHTAHAAHDGVSGRRVAPVAAVGIGVLAVRWHPFLSAVRIPEVAGRRAGHAPCMGMHMYVVV